MNLKQELKQIDLEFDNLFYERIEKFIQLLQQWGKIHNFTSDKALSDDEIIKNIIDSLYPLKFLDKFQSLLDVGTGAGYPGMILAIANTDANIILVEPRTKRVAFLNYLKSALKLNNLTVLENKVEDISSDIKCDIITSRAVTNISLLLSLTQKITTPQTQFLFYKGSMCEQEMKDININRYKLIKYGEFRNYLYIQSKGNL